VHPAHRGSICLETARILKHTAFDAGQYVLRLAAPRCAARAQPGSFAHLQCDATVRMRRPLSIMRVDRSAGWIELLYKVVGHGMSALAHHQTGDSLSVLGPIGRGFELHTAG
jgi:dihydroorotate dehydrogenase electron transfer subunit